MNAMERQEAILNILVARREESMQVLARELGVTDRTIRHDILVLTTKYPIETVRGHGGGVRLAKWFHPYQNDFTRLQTETLQNLMDRATDEERAVLEQLIREHSNYSLGK